MTESEIQKQIIDYLRLSGFIVFRMNSGQAKNNVKLCPPGTPDLFAVGPKGGVWIEVKTESGKLRQAQVDMIAELKRYCQKVTVARSVEDVKIFLDNIGYRD